MFENRLDRFEDGRHNEEAFRVLKIRSREIENKFRLDINKYLGKWKYSYGGVFQYVKFSNEGFTRIRNAVKGVSGVDSIPAVSVGLNSAIEFFRYGFFGEVNRKLMDNRLSLTIGLRADGNTFTQTGN
ncbi:MAG: TonB-dependent receptor, partial [Bacteroidota bacterium]